MILSPKKARELGVSDGDAVAVIGKRRRATYAIASVPSKKRVSNSACSISHNLATNIRVRDGDKIKIVTLGTGAEKREERSGDMVLLSKEPEILESVTYSPVEDSLNSLVASEGGDDFEDEELMERFITPYLNIEDDSGSVVAKVGSIVTMKDDNGKSLDFIISHVDDGEETIEGKFYSILQTTCDCSFHFAHS